MDPNEMLETLRSLIDEVWNYAEDPEVLASSLAEKFAELDEWLEGGGELPDEWEREA